MNCEKGRDHSCDKAVQGPGRGLGVEYLGGAGQSSAVDSDKDSLAQLCSAIPGTSLTTET